MAIIPVSHLVHIRRKFHRARDDHPPIVAWILRQIGHIFHIGTRLRDSRAGPLERQRTRWLQTRRHYEYLRRRIAHLRGRCSITPGSQLGKVEFHRGNRRRNISR